MSFVVEWLIGKGLPAWLIRPLLATVGLLLLGGIIYAEVKYHDRNIIHKHDANANSQVLEKTAPAGDNAAAARSTDSIKIEQQAKENFNAIHSVPDGKPSPAVRNLGCERLLHAGKDLTRISACAGFTSGR